MKFIEDIILEQSVDYTNWSTTKPSDFTTSKYDVKVDIRGTTIIKYYKLKSTVTGTSLSEYVGEFKTDTTPQLTVKTLIENDKLFFESLTKM